MKTQIIPQGHIKVSSAPDGAEFALMSLSNAFVQTFVRYGDDSFNTPNPDTLYFWGNFDNWQPVITKPSEFVSNNTFCTFDIVN